MRVPGCVAVGVLVDELARGDGAVNFEALVRADVGAVGVLVPT